MSENTNSLDGADDYKPLKISCKGTKCSAGLHCYQPKQPGRNGYCGPCRVCGEKLVEWKRVHQREIADVNYLLACMATEYIRHIFWCQPYDKKAILGARWLGRRKLYEKVPKRMTGMLSRAADAFDGRRTSFEGDVLCYAQHATATCCRKCVEEWHGIPHNRDLNARELEYLSLLVYHYLKVRPVPGITEDGERPKLIRESLGLPPPVRKRKEAVA